MFDGCQWITRQQFNYLTTCRSEFQNRRHLPPKPLPLGFSYSLAIKDIAEKAHVLSSFFSVPSSVSSNNNYEDPWDDWGKYSYTDIFTPMDLPGVPRPDSPIPAAKISTTRSKLPALSEIIEQ